MEKYDAEWHFQRANCCDCGQLLAAVGERYLNVVMTDYKATWEFPTAGNVLEGTSGIAVAVLCSSCLEKKPMQIKNCIEYRNDEVVYHPVSELEKMNRKAKRPTRIR